MNCQYCNRNFATISSLNIHIKTARYCINNRKNNEEDDIKKEDYTCKFCYKIFTRKDNVKKHILVCKNKNNKVNEQLLEKINEMSKEINNYKLEKENEEKEKLKEENKFLKERVEKLENEKEEITKLAIQKPTKIINNTNTDNSMKRITNNLNFLDARLSDLSKDDISKIFRIHYHEKHLLEGIDGLANFVLKSILITPDGKLRYICSDPSRNYFCYINENGKIIRDVDCDHLISLIHEPAVKYSKLISNQTEKKYEWMVNELEEEVEAGNVKKFSNIYDDAIELIDLEKRKSEHAIAKRNEIHQFDNKDKRKFIKNLINPLTKPDETLKQIKK